uniref:mitogen-activated protein kinase n=1 Tax=Gouania willdenowi TaxID=441366 RepID=A0A8C5H9W3_GOUWI
MQSPVKDSLVRPGFYRLEIQKTTWDVPVRYDSLRPVGSGAYGTVCSAIDQKTKEKVAIKKLYRPFQSLIHAKRLTGKLHLRVRSCVYMLLVFCGFFKVISLLDVFTPDSVLEKFQTFYMVMPFVAQDLGHIMKKKRLTDRIIVYLFYQLLRGLKILDFGLARQAESEMTGYVVTRWYRAPEVIFNWMHYKETVDVWSAACILAEMITGHVLFPGHDSIDQLKKIMRLTGTPDFSLVQKMQSKDAQSYVQGLPPQRKKNFREVFPNMEEKAVDLLEGMLLLDPDTRLTAKQGLSHPFLADYHDSESETDSEPYDDSFESLELAVGEWKSLIHMEIMTFDPNNPSKTAM